MPHHFLQNGGADHTHASCIFRLRPIYGSEQLVVELSHLIPPPPYKGPQREMFEILERDRQPGLSANGRLHHAGASIATRLKIDNHQLYLIRTGGVKEGGGMLVFNFNNGCANLYNGEEWRLCAPIDSRTAAILGDGATRQGTRCFFSVDGRISSTTGRKGELQQGG